jgi:hypothetical protein
LEELLHGESLEPWDVVPLHRHEEIATRLVKGDAEFAILIRLAEEGAVSADQCLIVFLFRGGFSCIWVYSLVLPHKISPCSIRRLNTRYLSRCFIAESHVWPKEVVMNEKTIQYY